MYCDDVIILSISVQELQMMLNLCGNVFKELDLPINVAKSHCIRIGPRYRATCSELTLNDTVINWTQSIQFLGIRILCDKCFKCCMNDAKKKFYCSVNTIFGRLGTCADSSVLLHLVNTQCLPNLLYGITAICLSAAELRNLNFAYNSVFCKIFKTSNANTILNCQYYSGNLTFTMTYEYQRYNFLNKLIHSKMFDKQSKVNEPDVNDYNRIQVKYNLKSTDSHNMIKSKMWNVFSSLI